MNLAFSGHSLRDPNFSTWLFHWTLISGVSSQTDFPFTMKKDARMFCSINCILIFIAAMDVFLVVDQRNEVVLFEPRYRPNILFVSTASAFPFGLRSVLWLVWNAIRLLENGREWGKETDGISGPACDQNIVLFLTTVRQKKFGLSALLCTPCQLFAKFWWRVLLCCRLTRLHLNASAFVFDRRSFFSLKPLSYSRPTYSSVLDRG